jgi:hypothetical protein
MEDRLPRVLALGALVWGLFSGLSILLNGIVVDETVYPAQIIANAVQYPAGHPHDIFYRTAFSLPNYFSAGMWAALPDTLAISAFRNWLFLFLSVYSVFVVAVVLSGRSLWGYVAAAILVLETHLRFRGVYPMWVFPNFYSNGHVGLHASVLTAGLLIGRFWRSAGLLVGLLPAIHATMALMIWPWAGLYMLFGVSSWKSRRRFLSGAIPGIAVGLLLAGLILLLKSTDTPGSPYDVATGGAALLEHYTATAHRAPIQLRSFGYGVNPLAFLALVVLFWWRSRSAGATSGTDGSVNSSEVAWRWVLFLGLVVWSYIFGTELFRGLGGALPGVIRTSMPGRFSNITAVLLVPVTVSGCALALSSLNSWRRTAGLAVIAILMSVAALLAVGVIPGGGRLLVSRNLLFVLWGVALGLLIAAASCRSERVGAAVAALLVAAALASFWSSTRVAAYLVAAAAISWIATVWGQWLGVRLSAEQKRLVQGRVGLLRTLKGILLVAASIAALAALPGRASDRLAPDRLRWDAISEDDREMKRWLQANTDTDELILTAYYWWRAEAQAKMDRPVLMEMETLFLVTYMAGLAPVLDVMTRDLYGVDFELISDLEGECAVSVSEWCSVWLDRWRDRSREEWRELSRKYNFTLVMSPSEIEVDLDLKVAGSVWSIYSID